jgi:regulatory factor X, other
MHSVSTQPNLDQSFASHHGAFAEQWTGTNPGQPKDIPPAQQQMPAEDMMLRPASQSFSMDSSIQSAVGGGAIPYPHHHQHHGLHHPMPNESFGANASFTDQDSQMLDRDDNDDGDSFAGLPTNSKPSSNRTSANNELEMRQLFHSSRHRKLEEVARELHGNERGPNSERTRQVFAMLWWVPEL